MTWPVERIAEANVFQTILAGLDGTQQDAAVLRMAGAMARLAGASLQLCVVLDPGYFLGEPEGGRPSPQDEVDYPAAAVEREAVDHMVRAAVAELRASGLHAEAMVVAGEAAESLLRSAAEVQAELMIIGHRHLSGLRRLAAHSVCHAVLEDAPIPVLVVPPDTIQLPQASTSST